ncbi:aspartic proteinase CDR1-like [Tasmannia lanceolata]|uniref:aspartic proteinase CDR1-like n=1 Tax=Tasmannia lanceolata TaxID=3420 RepID=UPI004063D948
MAPVIDFAHAILLSLAFFISLTNEFVQAGSGGFSVELIHRDSPLSPFYNPSVYDRVTKALVRSNHRVKHLIRSSANPSSAIPSSIQSPVVSNNVGPLFDPSKSSTYQNMSCNSAFCNGTPIPHGCINANVCNYTYGYADGSHTSGVLATETLTFDSTSGGSVQVPNIHGDGLFGLGFSQSSLFSHMANGKFSYCLVPILDLSSVSIMNFDNGAVFSGEGVVSTPLVMKGGEMNYFLTLEYITVGNKKINLSPGACRNVLFNSGAIANYLPTSVYKELVSAIKEVVSVPPINDPNRNLCYQSGTKLADMIYGFTGAEVRLTPLNTFLRMTERAVCIAVVVNDELFVYGNAAQMNFKVGYDLVQKKVSFAPTDCTKK